jgi:hypothetical protein
MNVLLNPEVWDVDKMEMLCSQRFNILGNYVVRESALCIERISTDTEGNWFYEIELRGESPVAQNKHRFPSFLNLLEFIEA